MKKIKKIVAVVFILSIFAIISQINTVAAETRKVILGGDTFGVRFYNNGVVIIKYEKFNNGSKLVCPAKESGLRINDIIKKAENKIITTNEDLQEILESSNGKKLKITIVRNGKELEKELTPQKNADGRYLMGVWIRDSCAGIGTVTFFDKENNSFAALGHGICDSDTNMLMPLGYAEMVEANVSSVTKSVEGKPGSLCGYFGSDTIGYMTKNTACGVYGNISESFDINKEEIEIMNNDEIKPGKASLYTCVDEGKIQEFDIEITEIRSMSERINKNFVIKVTDKNLINKTGGIIQGMSGSPIVQEGKLVGAVTHVFVNNPCEGYGITAQNMLSNYED